MTFLREVQLTDCCQSLYICQMPVAARSEMVFCRLTKQERRIVEDAAKKSDMKLSEYVRDTVLKRAKAQARGDNDRNSRFGTG